MTSGIAHFKPLFSQKIPILKWAGHSESYFWIRKQLLDGLSRKKGSYQNDLRNGVFRKLFLNLEIDFGILYSRICISKLAILKDELTFFSFFFLNCNNFLDHLIRGDPCV